MAEDSESTENKVNLMGWMGNRPFMTKSTLIAVGLLSSFTVGVRVAQSQVPDSVIASRDTAPARQHGALPVPRRRGRILGVFDDESMAPIEGAYVVDIFVNAVARTPANGLVELSAFQSRHDSSAVRVQKIGFTDTAFVIMTGPSDTIPVSVFLKRSAITLPAAVTEAIATKSSAPFGMIREFTDLANDKSSHPTIFSPAELRKADGRWLKDVLFEKGVGATLRCNAKGIRVYVDGVMQNDLGIPDGMSTALFEAAIYYPIDFAPPPYDMTLKQGCGVLILWHRQNNLP